MPTAKDFWSESKKGAATGATEMEFETTERRLGHKLPVAFYEIYSQRNGGYHDWRWIKLPGSEKLIMGLNGVLGKIETLQTFSEYSNEFEDESGEPISENPAWSSIWKKRNDLVVFSRSGGGSITWCLDYSVSKNDPKVVCFDDRSGFDGQPKCEFNNFADFLLACEPDPSGE